MQITFLQNGKTEEAYLKEGLALFEDRVRHFLPYESLVLPALKNTRSMPPDRQKQGEWELMKPHFAKSDCVVLLDEHGKEFTSVEFAEFLQKKMNGGVRNLLFVSGGPYGFAPEAHGAARHEISLSRMTFSHQMVRLFFAEQIYRAMTILKGLPYHNE